MQSNIFKARCSKIGDIMTESQGKSNLEKYNEALQSIEDKKAKLALCSEKAVKTKDKLTIEIKKLNQTVLDLEPIKDKKELSQTCMSYIDSWCKGTFWDRRKRVVSKAITKGNNLEYESIQNIMLVHELGFIDNMDNPSVSNDWLQGTCDLRVKPMDLIIDAKSSWNLSTFPMYKKINPNKGYEMQLQGYAELYDIENLWLCYVLNDSAPYMVSEAIRQELWKQQKENPGLKALSKEDQMFIIQDMTFTYAGYIAVCQELNITRDPNFVEIPLERRVKTFKFTRDRDFIQKVKIRVEEINEYINTNPEFEQDLITYKKQLNERTN